jgi:hypothetical protein
MHANCPPESGGQRHRVLCDDARGGSKRNVPVSILNELGSGTTPRTISTAVSIVLPS